MAKRSHHSCVSLTDWISEESKRSAVQVMLHLWRELEAEWQVCTNGVLTSIHKPLAGVGKRALWIPKQEVRDMGPIRIPRAVSWLLGFLLNGRELIQVQYGFLNPERRLQLRSVTNAASIDERMCKIYAVLHLLGFSNIHCLSAQDQATLTFVEKYVKFKQGEVWMDIAHQFHVTGFRPTGADRARLQSGIDFSEHLATVVIKDQKRLLLEAEEACAVQEKNFYEEKLAQAELEDSIRFYKVDKSLVTAKEKAAARMVRDQMLNASMETAKRELAEASWVRSHDSSSTSSVDTGNTPAKVPCNA
jgi:hypothetical protein